MAAYTIFSQSTNWALVSDANPYTLGMQFAVSRSVALTGIWFHSATGAAARPTECAIYNGDTATLVGGTDNASPSWSGAAGSGWIKVTYDGSITLTSGIHYVVVVLFNTTGSNWYSDTTNYWTTGAGSGGLSNGPLSAPNSASALNGQAVFHAGGTLTFPTTTQTGDDFGVDVEVSDIATVAGTVQPRVTVPVPRRRLARAVWAQITGQAFVAVPAPKQEYQLAPRRRLARAVWRGGAGQAYVAVPAPVQQYRLAPRRKPARAYVQFTPVVTTNAAAVAGVAGTVPVLMANQTRVVVRRDGRVVRR